jgi:hypothetical protein
MRTFVITFPVISVCSLFAAVGEAATPERRAVAPETTERQSGNLLDELAQISDKSALNVAEQQKAASLMRQYTGALRAGGYKPTYKELARVCDLEILHLPATPGDRDANEMNFIPDDTGNLPLATLDLLSEIMDQCRAAQVSNQNKGEFEDLTGRIETRFLQYDVYQNPEVLECAARQYRTHFLPIRNGGVGLTAYVEFLKSLPPRSGVSCRVVRDSYLCVEQDLRQKLHGLRKQPAEARAQLLASWRALRSLLADHLAYDVASDYDHEDMGAISACDLYVFHQWEQNVFGDVFAPALREVLSLKSATNERVELGLALADGVKAEKGLGDVLVQIHRLGLTPEDTITAVYRPSSTNLQPYGVGACSTILADVYRAAMGDDSLADVYPPADIRAVDAGDVAVQAAKRRTFRRNCASVFLASLQGFPTHGDETLNACVGELMFLAAQGMKAELARLSDPPDLEEWGERAGLYLAVADGSDQSRQRWLDSKSRFLGQIVMSGFSSVTGDSENGNALENGGKSGRGQDAWVRGVFLQYEERLPESLANALAISDPRQRERIRGSLLQKDAINDGRRQFVTAFLRAASNIRDAQEILCGWGFIDDEMGEARGNAVERLADRAQEIK